MQRRRRGTLGHSRDPGRVGNSRCESWSLGILDAPGTRLSGRLNLSLSSVSILPSDPGLIMLRVITLTWFDLVMGRRMVRVVVGSMDQESKEFVLVSGTRKI